jgi:hypothetical protein
MQSFHLTSFVASPLFLEELKKKQLPYDVLLSDIPYENPPLPYYGITNKPPQQNLLSFRTDALQQAKHSLIILGSLSLDSMQPLLKQFPALPFTIINLYVGMGSLGRKLAPEWEDLTAFPREIAKYEPIDGVHFFSILEQSHAKYLRIPHLHFPESIFSTHDIAIIDTQMLHNIEVLSLKGYGYAGDNGTLLATGANFATILQVGDVLQEQGNGMDMFVMNDLTFAFTEEIKSSLHQTKKLFIVIDHLANETFQELVAQRLKASGLKNVEVYYLTPRYEDLTTIFDEFSAEQAGFDAPHLAQQILSYV